MKKPTKPTKIEWSLRKSRTRVEYHPGKRHPYRLIIGLAGNKQEQEVRMSAAFYNWLFQLPPTRVES